MAVLCVCDAWRKCSSDVNGSVSNADEGKLQKPRTIDLSERETRETRKRKQLWSRSGVIFVDYVMPAMKGGGKESGSHESRTLTVLVNHKREQSSLDRATGSWGVILSRIVTRARLGCIRTATSVQRHVVLRPAHRFVLLLQLASPHSFALDSSSDGFGMGSLARKEFIPVPLTGIRSPE